VSSGPPYARCDTSPVSCGNPSGDAWYELPLQRMRRSANLDCTQRGEWQTLIESRVSQAYGGSRPTIRWFQVDDSTTGGLAPVYAIRAGCVAVGTENSTYMSLEKLSFSVRFANACALQPVLHTA